MKKKFLAMLAKKEARKTELGTKATSTADIIELRSINSELDILNGEIAELRSAISDMPDDVAPPVTPVVEGRGATPIPQGPLNVIGSYGATPVASVTPEARGLDAIIGIHDPVEMRSALMGSPEYRTAYLKNLQGRSLSEPEQRAITTAVGTGGAAVPTTTYDKIIEKLRQTSVLFPEISVTYIPGNVVLPVANALNAAIWSAEATTTTNGDDSVSGVSLAGYTLAKFAPVSIAAMVMTIDAFETYIVNQISVQLSIAIENAILNGAGSGATPPAPTGILTSGGVTFDSSNSTTWAKGAALGYDDVVGLRALLNSVYRPFAKFIINRNMEAAIMKVKSSTGFPLFSQSPQEGFSQKILGQPYLLDEYIPDNTILYCCPSYYYMNFSQAPIIEADRSAGFTTSSIIYRGLLIADGKPALSEAFCKLTQATV